MGAFLPSVFCQQLLVRVNGQVPLEGKGVLEGPGPAVPQVPEVDIVVGGVPRQAQIGEAVEVHIPEVQGMKLVFGAEAGGGALAAEGVTWAAVSESKARGWGSACGGVMV